MDVTGKIIKTILLFSVFGIVSCGTGSSGGSGDAVQAPNQPVDLKAAVLSESHINLKWLDTSDNEDGFRIERRIAGSTNFVDLATVAADNFLFFDNSGLVANTSYEYRVIAINSAGESKPSAIAGATTPAAPTTPPKIPLNLSATANSSSSIQLSWLEHSTDETGFEIERSAAGAFAFTVINTVGPNVTEYTDNTGLSASTAYDYRVRAINSAGSSKPSTAATATTLAAAAMVPNAASDLDAIAASSSSIVLTWTDNANNETGFRIERGSPTGFTSIAILAANVTSYTDSFGLSASSLYSYRVIATNGAGESSPSATAEATTLAPPISIPTAPIATGATATSASSIEVIWLLDLFGPQTGHQIERSLLSNSGFSPVGIVSGSNNRFIDSGLSASTTYYYRIAATNSAGASAFSNTVSATTAAGVPNVPTLSLISNANGNILLEWTYVWTGIFASSSDGYMLEESATSPTTGYTPIFISFLSGDRQTPKTFSAINRSAGTYYYRVRAHNGGWTGYSNVLAVTVVNNPVTNVYPITSDNLLIFSNSDASLANTAYAVAENAVGCNWSYDSGSGFQGITCFISLLYFQIGAEIDGKNIVDARLRIYPEILPASFTQYKLWAVAETWPGNVTWNTQPDVFTNTFVVFSQPVTTVLATELDVTSIVQNWADGSWINFGFLVEDNNYIHPLANELRATGFCSKENVPSCVRPPELEITYQ